MNKRFYLLALLIVSVHVLRACGPEPINREFSLFLKTYNKSDPFYYYYFNRGSFRFSDFEADYYNKQSANETEWVRILNNKFPSYEIEAYLNAPRLFYKSNKKKARRSEEIDNYLRKRKPLWKRYVDQLKEYANYTEAFQDKWDYKGYVYRNDSSALFKLIDNTKSIYNETDDPMLKWRCAYHAVRMAHFHKYTYSADELYNELVNPLPNNMSVMELWCLGLRGGILKRKGNKEEAFLNFARRFMRDTSDYHRAYIDLKHLHSIDIQRVLSLCKNDDDRLAVFVAKSVNTSNFDIGNLRLADEQIRDEKKLKFIYQRELQKLEADYIKNRLMANDKSNPFFYSDNLQVPEELEYKALYNFTKNKTLKPQADAYWHNAMAYLALTKKKYKEVNYHLGIAQKSTSKLNRAQANMLAFMTTCFKGGTINEKSLAAFIIDFYSEKAIAKDDRNSLAIFTYNFMLPKLLEEGKVTEAIAIAALRDEGLNNYYYWGHRNKSDSVDIMNSSQFVRYYLNYAMGESDYKKTIKELQTGTSVFFKTLRKKFTFYVQPEDYNRFLMYKKVRQEDWKNAVALCKQLTYFKNETFYKPFATHYDDYRNPVAKDSALGALTAVELLQLGEQLSHDLNRRNPMTYYRYGQFLYHLTYYGYNRALMDNNTHETRHYTTPVYYAHKKIETQEWYYWFHRRYKVSLNPEALTYYNCRRASYYLQQALRFAKIDDEKAKINFLLARCYQKNTPLPSFKKDERYGWLQEQAVSYKGKNYFNYSYHSFKNPYFKVLKDQYAHTKTYQEAFSECSYLRMFLD